MRYVSSVLLALSAIGLGSAHAIEAPSAVPVGGKIDWVYSYALGKKLAQAAEKPMFVVFRCER